MGFHGFMCDDTGHGFRAGKVYPGQLSQDGQTVVLANDEGRFYRMPVTQVRTDTQGWRRSAGLTASEGLAADNAKRIATLVRTVHERVISLRKDRAFAPGIEAVKADLRAIAEIADPALAKELWAAVDDRTRTMP